MVSPDTDSPTMVTGTSSYNYSNNSSFQRKFVGVVKSKIDELISKKLDLDVTMASCNTFRIVDLGCAIGPNTFFNVQDIIQ
ncbi:unnamed protein product [Linum tenue]|uniref:S-adenosylmethionine-dependent methyltransferase n=1 Tax=Linum tenue TaxID=586396 RepID=A0AAV0MF55_9ROSI|nr:unnamed protein product [Linum tenue]